MKARHKPCGFIVIAFTLSLALISSSSRANRIWTALSMVWPYQMNYPKIFLIGALADWCSMHFDILFAAVSFRSFFCHCSLCVTTLSVLFCLTLVCVVWIASHNFCLIIFCNSWCVYVSEFFFFTNVMHCGVNDVSRRESKFIALFQAK